MIVNQANLHGLTVGYSTAFNKSFDTTQSNYQKVATVVPSTTGEQDYKWLGQMPGMREWIGEREVQALAAYDYLIKNKKFEMTIGVPRDDIEDDKYGVYTPLFSNMGEAAALQPDELVFGAMMSGFNEKCYDGLSFFNTAHKVGDATYSNRSNKKLSRESYMEGRSSIMSIKGDKGKSLKLVPDLLVVPPALEETARLILEADQIDGTTNVLKGTAKLHVEPALAEHPEYWFLLCTNRFLKPFIYQLRKKIKFTSLTRDTDENVFMLDEYLYYVTSANMMSPEGSDYSYAEDVRVSNRLVKAVRAKALDELQVEVDPGDIETSITNIQEQLNTPVEDAVRDKVISSGSVTIDTENLNILVDEKLDINITYVPMGHVREMNLTFAVENPYAAS